MKNRLPRWFNQELPDGAVMDKLRLISESCIHTVCREAKCPNIARCFKDQEMTFLILGNSCTRSCRFCNVEKKSADQMTLDIDEPKRVSRIIEQLGLRYVVITSVTRDDLSDGGAEIFFQTIKLIREIDEKIKIEVLIPDFQGKPFSIKRILEAKPFIVAHNLETVRRIYPEVRPDSDYASSLKVLKAIKDLNPRMITKSSLMLGMGETEEELKEALIDLRNQSCDILTLGQYLAPSNSHYPVKGFISPEKFRKYQSLATALGFKAVSSGPLVRSSYQAERLSSEALHA